MSKNYSQSQNDILREIDWSQDESKPIISKDEAERLSIFNHCESELPKKLPIRIAWEHHSD